MSKRRNSLLPKYCRIHSESGRKYRRIPWCECPSCWAFVYSEKELEEHLAKCIGRKRAVADCSTKAKVELRQGNSNDFLAEAPQGDVILGQMVSHTQSR